MLIGPQMIKQTLAIASLVVLVGCESYIEDWTTVPKPRKPQVSQVQYSHSVSFSPASADLSGPEGERLYVFLNNAKASRKDVYYLVSNNPQVPASLSNARKSIVTDYLSTFDVQISTLPSDFGVKLPAGDDVNLIIRRYVVTLPGCPDWSGSLNTYNNTTSSNWGCASATNLGLMIAEPGDLLLGRDEGMADGEHAAMSINRYRTGETKALTPEDIGVIESQQKSAGGQ